MLFRDIIIDDPANHNELFKKLCEGETELVLQQVVQIGKDECI